MNARSLVEKYIFNREGVVTDPVAFDALLAFGHDPENIEALAVGASRLQTQLHGSSLILLLVPDENDTEMKVELKQSTLALDGADAHLIQRGVFPKGRGIFWRTKGETELVHSKLREDQSYVELARTTEALYNVPMESPLGRLGVFSIESDQSRNFFDPKIRTYISNFAELVLFYQLNRQLVKLGKTEADMKELLRARELLEENTALGFREAWELLALLAYKKRITLDEFLQETHETSNYFECMCRLFVIGFISYEQRELVLTIRGKEELQRFGLIK